MKINKDILKKAEQSIKDKEAEAEYRRQCLRGGICPLCGGKAPYYHHIPYELNFWERTFKNDYRTGFYGQICSSCGWNDLK